MEKREYKIGETFQCGITTLKCVKEINNRGCNGCFFEELCTRACSISRLVGNCSCGEREDEEDVIFIEVPSQENDEKSTESTSFKDGDFLVTGRGNIFIFNGKLTSGKRFGGSYAYGSCEKDITIESKPELSRSYTEIDSCRFATEGEIDYFLGCIRNRYGKVWDKENRKFVKWIPKNGEVYYYVTDKFTVAKSVFDDTVDDEVERISHNNFYPTFKVVIEYINRIKKLNVYDDKN